MNLHKSIQSLFSKYIVVSWILSYLIICSVPFANNIYTYMKTENEIKQRIYDSDNQILNNLRLSFDKSISDFSIIAAGVQNSEYIQNLLTMDPGTPAFDQNRFNAAKNINLLKAYNSNISDIFVYVPASDYCIGSGFTAKRREFFSYAYNGTDAMADIWSNNLNKLTYASYMVSTTTDGSSFVDFFYSIPLSNNTSKATVIIRISSDLFNESISDYTNINEKTLFVLDSNNQTVLGKTPASLADYSKIPNGISFDEKTGDMIISCTSEINNWKYISITPKKFISDQLLYMRIPIVLTSVICVVIVFLLIFYFTRKNYEPLKKIINVAKNNAAAVDSHQNEYDIINDILNDYISNKQQLKSIRHYESSEKKANFLSDLANGYTQKHPNPKKEMEKLDIHFISDYFAVVCFNITNANHLFSNDENNEQINDDETANIIQFIMTNIFEELIGKYNCGYMTETDGRLICIISFNTQRLSCYHSDIAQAVSEAKQFIEKNFMFSFTASVSSIHKGLDAISSAYWEANKTMSYRSFIKNEDMIIFEDIQTPASNDYFNDDTERKLINFIKLGDHDIVRSIVDGIFTDNSLSINQAHILTVRIASAVSAAVLGESESETSVDYSEFMRCIDELITTRGSYTSYKEKLHRLIVISCDIMEHHRNSDKTTAEKIKASETRNSDILTENVKNYIQQNYNDSELHLVSLGDYFDITPYYLSNIFKKTEGVTLMDYIARLRISEAKTLIDNSDIPMSEIASKVGFNNVRTFLRTFRKFEGITPSQYKELKK